MISSVNVAKSQFPADSVSFTEELLNGKLHFMSSAFNLFIAKVSIL